MKIILAIDGSQYSEAAIMEITNRPWPPGSRVKVLTVIYAATPKIYDPVFFTYPAGEEPLKEARKLAPQMVEKAAQKIRSNTDGLEISTEVLEGSPKQIIIEEAGSWGADLIVLGSHGYEPVSRFGLGSVAMAVALHAPCSVEIVRIQK